MNIQALLSNCVNAGASDLHLIPNMHPLMRLHGDLIPIEKTEVMTPESTKEMILSLMGEEQRQLFQSKLVIDLAVHLPDIGVFRLSAFHQIRGMAAVLRMVPASVPDFDQLGLPPILKRFSVLPHGLVLVVGATGSGKSTTLASLVNYINAHRACHIMTIEDPIEFIYESKKAAVNQIQVGRDTHDFATSLRSALRQDPDVILIGEMRDLETIRLALTAAETGHLVLATLHAASAPLAISRIVDVFPSSEQNSVRTLLAETMQAVICQTLVKRSTGGRIPAFEVLLGIPSVKHYIHQDMIPHMESAMQTNGDIGMCTMAQYLQQLASKGLINPSVAKNIIANRDSFRSAVPQKKSKHSK